MTFHGTLPATVTADALVVTPVVTSQEVTSTPITLDVHDYASVFLVDRTNAGGAAHIQYAFISPTIPNQVLAPTSPGGLPLTPEGFYDWSQTDGPADEIQVPVEATKMIVKLAAGDSQTIRLIDVYGSNRPVVGTVAGQARGTGFSTTGFTASTGLIAISADQEIDLTLNMGTLFQGPAAVDFVINGSLTGKGRFVLAVETSSGSSPGTRLFDLTDTAEPGWHTIQGESSLVAQSITKNLAFPAMNYTLSFRCAVGATMDAFISAIPAY